MMFHADITFVLALIALAMSVGLLMLAKQYEKSGVLPWQIFGYIILVLAIIVLIFSGIKTMRHCCRKGHYRHGRMMISQPMMMKRCKMMRDYKMMHKPQKP